MDAYKPKYGSVGLTYPLPLARATPVITDKEEYNYLTNLVGNVNDIKSTLNDPMEVDSDQESPHTKIDRLGLQKTGFNFDEKIPCDSLQDEKQVLLKSIGMCLLENENITINYIAARLGIDGESVEQTLRNNPNIFKETDNKFNLSLFGHDFIKKLNCKPLEQRCLDEYERSNEPLEPLEKDDEYQSVNEPFEPTEAELPDPEEIFLSWLFSEWLNSNTISTVEERKEIHECSLFLKTPGKLYTLKPSDKQSKLILEAIEFSKNPEWFSSLSVTEQDWIAHMRSNLYYFLSTISSFNDEPSGL